MARLRHAVLGPPGHAGDAGVQPGTWLQVVSSLRLLFLPQGLPVGRGITRMASVWKLFVSLNNRVGSLKHSQGCGGSVVNRAGWRRA